MSEPGGVHVLAAADRVALPWLNGGGVTSEVAARPLGGDPAAFDWRLSIATIAGDNPFSSYPGVDRLLMPLSPQGLDLLDGGAPVHVRQFDVHRFAGENEVASFGVWVPTLDLNLMTRRGRCTGSLLLTQVSGDWTVQAGVEEDITLVVLDGSLHLGERRLTALDAVLVERGRLATVRGTAHVAVARVANIRRD
jgi:environmental stress-induced protein Ves